MLYHYFVLERMISWTAYDKTQQLNVTSQNITALHMKGCLFIKDSVEFNLYGKATFDNCFFIANYLPINLHEGKSESRPSNENMKRVVPHSELYQLQFRRTQFRLRNNVIVA